MPGTPRTRYGQSRAGRLLFDAAAKPEVKDLVCAFLFGLHDLVIERGFYDPVRQPETLACVEIACGLEGTSQDQFVGRSLPT